MSSTALACARSTRADGAGTMRLFCICVVLRGLDWKFPGNFQENRLLEKESQMHTCCRCNFFHFGLALSVIRSLIGIVDRALLANGRYCQCPGRHESIRFAPHVRMRCLGSHPAQLILVSKKENQQPSDIFAKLVSTNAFAAVVEIRT